LKLANSLDKAERNHGLDLLRGLAAFGIVVYHYLYMAHGIRVESLGTFGVYLFFMLSGLTMMLVYGPQSHGKTRCASTKIVSRAFCRC
jgi:peptidoglycan/LPS O-acetylase OafA/YrhL